MAKVKFFKCIVKMAHIRIEEFNDEGTPVIVEKTDMFKNMFLETVEKTYTRGEIIVLPEAIVEKLGNSVELVMAPVELSPVEAEPGEEVEETAPEGDFKPTNDSDTVAGMIPKPEKDKGKGGKSNKGK